MRRSTLLAGFLILVGAIDAGLWPVPARATALRDVTERDAASWKLIDKARLTPDGRWLVYQSIPTWSAAQGGPVEVIVRSTTSAAEERHRAGHSTLGAGSLKMSRSGRWIAFHVAPAERDGSAVVRLGVALIDLHRGTRRDFPAVSAFDFLGGAEDLILMQSYPSETAPHESGLTVMRLFKPGIARLDDVAAFAASPSGTRVAWIGSSGAHDYDVTASGSRTLDKVPGNASSQIVWSPRGNALAVLRPGTSTAHELLILRNLSSANPTKTVLTPQRLSGFPAEHEIHATLPTLPDALRAPKALHWREDERGLFLGIRPVVRREAPGPTVPKLALWHWRDDRLPVQKRLEANEIHVDLGFVFLESPRFVRFTHRTLSFCTPHERARFLPAYDLGAYGWQNALTGTGSTLTYQLRDYYLVDLHTGERRPFMRGLRVHSGNSAVPQLSPDGRFLLYKNNDGDYVAYELATAIHRNLTADLPTEFYHPENDPKTGLNPKDPNDQGLPFVQGWTVDGSHVLISDHYDIWALPLKRGRALNLTGDGRKKDIWYRRIVLTDFAPDHLTWSGRIGTADVNLRAPIYFKARDLRTGDRGLVRWNPASRAAERLHWEFADTNYFRAERADVYLYSRMTAVASQDFYRMDATWRPRMRLTDINPQQRTFRWSPGLKYLTYETSRGDIRHALLRLPAGYIDGKKYPTVVGIYKTLTGAVHAYRQPSVPADTESWLLRHGYARLLPDVDPRVNEAGAAALEAVTAAVKAAVATGIVDPDRLGLMGHSYGAFEAAYIVSRTDLFNAAVPYAGVMNQWSAYGEANEGLPKSFYHEHSQPYFAGPWWEHWEAYLENSPLYHARTIDTPLLLVHGDADTAVPFSQSLQLFNTLRRMGNKPVVLLQYVGENHQLSWGDGHAERDYQQRMLEFFDHFLKGAPAPAWWADGVSYYEGQVPASQ